MLNVLQAFASKFLPLNVLGAARIPLQTSDWRSTRLGRDGFLQASVPDGWWEDYASMAKLEYDPGIMMARSSLMACTWTETMLMLDPIGIDRWPYELSLKYGMRDALTCSVGRRWLVAYWSGQTLSKTLTQPFRIILFAAASFVALRLEQLIDHDLRFMGKRARIAPRELAVLRLVSTGQAQSNARPSPMRDFQDMIESQRSQVRDRIAGAIGRIEGACREELHNFCSTVTPGEGRLLLCMQAHEDKLSNQCELALFDASRHIQQTMQKIGRAAEACWTDIQMQCGCDSSIAQCISEKRANLSPRWQAAAAELRPAPQQEAPRNPSLAGTPIFSADGVKVGEVTAVRGGLDGKAANDPGGDRQPTGTRNHHGPHHSR